MVPVAASGAERSGRGACIGLRRGWRDALGRLAATARAQPGPVLSRPGRGVGRWPTCRWRSIYHAVGLDALRPVLVPVQPAAALPRLFLRRLRDRGATASTAGCWRATARWRGAGPLWLAAALAGFGLWAGPTSLTLDASAGAPLLLQIAAGLGFVVACAAGCFFLLAVCLRFARRGRARSTACPPMPTACISCTTCSWSGCNLRCWTLALFAIGKAAIVLRRHAGDELGRLRPPSAASRSARICVGAKR